MGHRRLAGAGLALGLVVPLAALLNVLAASTEHGPLAAVATGAAVVLPLFYAIGLPATVAAVVLGHVALHLAGRRPGPEGRRGMAVAALASGYLGVALLLALNVAFVVAGRGP